MYMNMYLYNIHICKSVFDTFFDSISIENETLKSCLFFSTKKEQILKERTCIPLKKETDK